MQANCNWYSSLQGTWSGLAVAIRQVPVDWRQPIWFKQAHGTEMAIFAVKQTVDFYHNHDTHVYMCYLDAKKAFDRVNHWTLAKKLLDRNGIWHMASRSLLTAHVISYFCNSCPYLYALVGEIKFIYLFILPTVHFFSFNRQLISVKKWFWLM